MKELRWSGEEGRLFLLLSAVFVVRSSEARARCPDDVNSSARICLQEYRSLSGGSTTQLFMGADVEFIRTLCGALRRSSNCALEIKRNCPDTEHSEVEVVLGEVTSMAELCLHKGFIEVYARNQYCYHTQSAYSEKCYATYRAEAEPLRTTVYTGNPAHLTRMCRALTKLIDCVGTNVRLNCNNEAASLAPLLVKAAIPLSKNCNNETLFMDSPKTTPRASAAGGPSSSRRSSAASQKLSNPLLSALLILTVLSTPMMRRL